MEERKPRGCFAAIAFWVGIALACALVWAMIVTVVLVVVK